MWSHKPFIFYKESFITVKSYECRKKIRMTWKVDNNVFQAFRIICNKYI